MQDFGPQHVACNFAYPFWGVYSQTVGRENEQGVFTKKLTLRKEPRVL